MRNLLFWQRWPAPERTLFNITTLLFGITIASLAYYYIVTPSPVVEFQSIVEAQLAEVPFESFRKGAFELSVPGNSYTLTERLLGTPLSPNLTANYLWLGIFVLSVTGLLAVVTTLSRYYYLLSMGVFILLVVSLKLETLLMFGRDDRVFSVMILLVFGLGSFHIYYFLPGLKFLLRVLYFFALTVITAVVIFFFSAAELPGLHIATYSFPAGMVATLLFIVTVAHEIIASFITILTRSTRQGRTINHFLIITLIYMLNLVAVYALKFGFIRWNIFTIDVFLLLVVSGVLGIWGFRQRQKILEGIVDIEPGGMIGYVLLGCLAFGSISTFFGTANDPAYDAVADIVIFTHLGYGLIFVFYIISNFGNMLSQNMAVHKVLYNPTTMPFFTFRLAGLIATLALLIFNTWQVPAHNAVAGYQNAVAGLYLMEENNRVAAVYYDQGRTYGFSNHHSNYALANLAGLRFDHEGEKGFYKSASYLRPTEMSYLNWAQMWQSEQDDTTAIGVLKEGLTQFPRSSAISNSLGLLYAELGQPDSAALYLQIKAAPYVQSNLLALAARNKLPLLADSAYRQRDNTDLMTNKIAFAMANGIVSHVPLTIGADSALTNSAAAYINNYVVNHPGLTDTTTLKQIEALARLEVNMGLAEPLLFSTALGFYSAGNINKAFKLMEEVAIVSSGKGKYNNILGLWCLEQDEPVRGQGYLEFALSQQYTGALVTHAVSLTEGLRYGSLDKAHNMRQALAAWDSVSRIPDSTLSKLAARMTSILTAAPASVASMSDDDKYAYARYRLRPWDPGAAATLSTITDPNVMARGFLETSQQLLDYDDLTGAISLYDKIRGVRVTDTQLFDDLRLHERLLLASAGDIDGLRKAGESPLQLAGRNEIYRTYFDAVVANAAGDTTTASELFKSIADHSLFFAEGIIGAADFFSVHGTDGLRSYNLLVDAVQHHPSSVRLRKAYIREALRIGFSDFALDALKELREIAPPQDYAKLSREISEGR